MRDPSQGLSEFDPPFEVLQPAGVEHPIVLNSPHSGAHYPAAFLGAARLDALTLRRSEDAFVDDLFAPATAHGVRVAGAPSRAVRRVAVCGGAGDFLLDRMAGADVDVYLTSDLRHHPAAEFAEKGGPALVDVAHWAAEWTWLPAVEARLRREMGDRVDTRVSTRCTDPWTFRH